jgi:hypothetical protein
MPDTPETPKSSAYDSPAETQICCEVNLRLRLGLLDLRRQKDFLYVLGRVPAFHDTNGVPVDRSPVDGLLNLLDALQDAIVDQGLAAEDDVFGFRPSETP